MSHKITIYADYQATTPVDPRVSEKMARGLGALALLLAASSRWTVANICCIVKFRFVTKPQSRKG